MSRFLVVLVPARNAAGDLPGLFESIRGLADAVVALDDGSTDGTREVLAAEPLVEVLLTNPRREDYRGWDDAANRNRLLEAAAALEPEWILSLDADERIDAGDAAALRTFLETDALPGCAYGFRHVPMRGDVDHYLPRYQWVYRLFAYQPGQRFPDQRLHFVPVPTSIPRSRWIRTTLRIQHFGGMTSERRLVRFAKYLEADATRAYQSSYTHLLDEPDAAALRRWEPRPADMPVLLAASGVDDELLAESLEGGDPDVPVISAVIIARNDEETIARSVAAVVGQKCPEPFEVIVVASGTDRTAAIVRERFPTVGLIELDRPALPGEARNAGLRAARGKFISFPGSHVELPQGSLAARLAAHRRGYAMVTGVTQNGNKTRAGWASYFLDHHINLPGSRATELSGPPAHCSYARLPLLEVGGFPEGVRTGEDTAVNRALVRKGYVAFRDPAVTITHRSPCRTVGKLVRHHFVRGRGWGRLFVEEHRAAGRMLRNPALRRRGFGHLRRRLLAIDENVRSAAPSLLPHYEAVRGLIRLGAIASWAGMWCEILRPAPGKLTALLGQPVRTIALATHDASGTALSVLRVDAIAGRVQILTLSAETRVALPGHLPKRLDAVVLDVLSGEERAIASRLRTLASAITQLPVDDIIAGSGRALAVVRLADQSAPVRAAALPDVVRVKFAALAGSARTSLSAFAMWGLLRQVRDARTFDTIAVHGGSDEPIVIRAEAWTAASTGIPRGTEMRRSRTSSRTSGAGWRSWMP